MTFCKNDVFLMKAIKFQITLHFCDFTQDWTYFPKQINHTQTPDNSNIPETIVLVRVMRCLNMSIVLKGNAKSDDLANVRAIGGLS